MVTFLLLQIITLTALVLKIYYLLTSEMIARELTGKGRNFRLTHFFPHANLTDYDNEAILSRIINSVQIYVAIY